MAEDYNPLGIIRGSAPEVVGRCTADALGVWALDLWARLWGDSPPAVVVVEEALPPRVLSRATRQASGVWRIALPSHVLRHSWRWSLARVAHELAHVRAERDGAREEGYRGHGPRFARACNQSSYGGELVAPAGRGGRDPALWPVCLDDLASGPLYPAEHGDDRAGLVGAVEALSEGLDGVLGVLAAAHVEAEGEVVKLRSSGVNGGGALNRARTVAGRLDALVKRANAVANESRLRAGRPVSG